MNRSALGVAFLVVTACGADPKPDAESPPPVHEETAKETTPAKKGEGVPEGWSTVEPFTSDTEARGPSKQSAQIVVTSDPKKHGDAVHFNFWVNRVRINGVFEVRGGGTATFRLPAGTVEFGTDECSLDLQGVELQGGESVPVGCELGSDGDCCEVRIPVEADDADKAGKATQKKGKKGAGKASQAEGEAREEAEE